MHTKKIRVATTLALLLSGTSYAAAQSYTVTDLGASLGVGPASSPTTPYMDLLSINGSGQVAATKQTPPSTAILIGTNLNVSQISSPAYGTTGINDSGQVVGVMPTSAGVRSFITGPNGSGLTALGDLPGSTNVYAASINNAGQVVGTAFSGGYAGNYYAPNLYSNAFITGANGSDIQLIPNLGSNSTALDINNNGLVVGTYSVAGKTRSYVFNAANKGVTELGSLGGGDTQVTAVNDTGKVVGSSRGDDGKIYAFMADTNGANMKSLGLVGGLLSSAYDINDAGQIVGTFLVGGSTSHAFVTTGVGGTDAVDLNSLVTLPNGVFLMSATGINNLGQIVAYGSDFHGYLLTVSSVPEPSQALLLLLGLIGTRVAYRRNGKRLGA